MAVIFEVVSSLVNNCLEKISKDVSLYENLFEGLPLDLKRKLTKKLSMRGLLKDCHLRKVLQRLYIIFCKHRLTDILLSIGVVRKGE